MTPVPGIAVSLCIPTGVCGLVNYPEALDCGLFLAQEVRLLYRVFYTAPDGSEGACDVSRACPLDDLAVDEIERELLILLGCGNVLVIGWQRLDGPAFRNLHGGPP